MHFGAHHRYDRDEEKNIILYFLFFLGGVIIDQPYGLGQEDWDKAWTEEEYLVLFKQLDAAAKKDNFWVAMYCNHWLLGPTMAAMEKHGFTNVAYMCGGEVAVKHPPKNRFPQICWLWTAWVWTEQPQII